MMYNLNNENLFSTIVKLVYENIRNMRREGMDKENRLKHHFSYVKRFKVNSIFNIVFLLIFFLSNFSFDVQASTAALEEARSIIKENYISPVPDSVLNKSTIEEIIKGLNDPYSQYFSKQEEEDFMDTIDNKMHGIGIYMEIVPEGVKVEGVIENSPAYEAGIKEGYIIISANGQSLAGLTSEQASSLIKGELGTTVNLVVKTGDGSQVFDVMRREISLPTVTGEMINDHTAYVSITSFGRDTSQLFAKKLQELRMQSPDNYIVDLRYNGGGYMSSALEVAGNFVGEEPVITVEDRDGGRTKYYEEFEGNTIDKPIIFLINEYTASASEILAAAVKDYNKAFFVGTTTYGKGVAQQIFQLSDGSSIKLTIQKFYSPMENEINKVGISPDFEVKGIDSLAVAELFSEKYIGNVDKRGYVKVNVGGEEFHISLSLARDEEHWAAFKYIISHVSKEDVYIGTKNGWTQAPADYFDNFYKFLYGDYRSLDTLKNVDENKVFTITFNKDVSLDTIKKYTDIEVINAETGERAAFDINKIDDTKIGLTPKEKLKKGQTYYIKIKNIIKPFTVKG